MSLLPVGASADTVWRGAPGEPIPTGVSVRITDDRGDPVAGAAVLWEPRGVNGTVVTGSSQTNDQGLATAVWVLGTNANEVQQLRVTARVGRRQRELYIRAEAVPHIVAQLRVSLDTPAVVRLGDSLPIVVTAVDPFGNRFPAPSPRVAVADTSVGAVTGATVVAGPRRGLTQIVVTSDRVSLILPLRVIQNVVAIVPEAAALRFTSLGAELPVRYVLRDDKGGVVEDTVAALLLSDTVVARVSATGVQARARGTTTLRLSVGSVSADLAIEVQQRIASLGFHRDTIRFDALRDTTSVRIIARDSLGFPIYAPAVTVQVPDSQVAMLATEHLLEALAPGLTFYTAIDPETGVTASIPVVVRQVVRAIQPSSNRVVFDALGDSTMITATPFDRLGSPVVAAVLDYSVGDTAVTSLTGGQLRALRPGQTSVTVRDPATGIAASVDIVVDQVATSLTVASTFGNPIVTLPVGSPFPLACLARDRNGYEIARDPLLVGTVKGTVTGSGCADAQVARSGYDTLVFAAGTLQTRLAVIVATVQDSVGIVTAAQRLSADPFFRYVGENLEKPTIAALRPLAAEILAAYGNPTTNLGRARAIRDWVARTAVYPDAAVHPNGSTSNLSVLPPGTTWADVNATLSPEQWNRDNEYWMDMSADGYVMLDRLLGTLDPTTGVRADDGLMVRVAGAQYRIRDLQSYRFLLCTYQTVVANALWAATGLHSMLVQIPAHQPAAVFIPELGRWVYEDVSYNDDYLLDGVGDPLSPLDLLDLANDGTVSRARESKISGPGYDAEVYIQGRTYMDVITQGMEVLGSRLYMNDVPNPTAWTGYMGMIDVPALANYPEFKGPRLTRAQAFPNLGVVVENIEANDSVFVVRLASTFPNHVRFERRLQGGDWEPVTENNVLPVGACQVEYRSIDPLGNSSANAVLDVWAPRAPVFFTPAVSGTAREQSRLCI